MCAPADLCHHFQGQRDRMCPSEIIGRAISGGSNLLLSPGSPSENSRTKQGGEICSRCSRTDKF